jgi:phosphomannomutase
VTLFLLEPRVQHYAWGDTRFIPALLGRENEDRLPFAELWMGAHPELPSGVGATDLRELIAREPERVLGPAVSEEFGGELPYLFKVLSAATPLSLQAHPNLDQAQAGFLRESEAGIPLDARHRSYKDPRAKPELLAALTDFYAFVGFRPLEEIAAVLEEVPELHRVGRGFEPTEASLAGLYQKLMALEQAEVNRILDPILARLKRTTFERDRREFWMVRCGELFSREGRRDRGLLATLLLNLVRLRPGEAVFLEAGVLHAYLEGSAVEIMSSSNNVLRGGLTEKHVDVGELMRTVVFSGKPPVVLRPMRRGEGELVYQTPAKEFELGVLDVERLRPHRSEPAYSAEILFVVDPGAALEVSSQDVRIDLRRGRPLLVTAGTSYRVSGQGRLFRAAVPDRSPRFRGGRPAALRFGTSGLRGLVADMTDLEVFINARAFLDYLLERREIYRGDPVSIAGDLRASTERILRAVSRAIQEAGFRPEFLGRVPTPALTYAAISRRRASVMVTGSHIPFDRNGIKFNRPTGEVLKRDEAGILAAVRRHRALEYARPEAESLFGDDGMMREGKSPALPAALPTAREAYIGRYLDFFPEDALSGKRLVFFQHSAVGRDLLVELLTSLGAEVFPMERSDSFVPIDTEDVSEERLLTLSRLASVARETFGAIDAIVSTDGDSDRPLVVGLLRESPGAPEAEVQFFPGDLLGILVADYLDADAVVVPVSVTDAVDLWFDKRATRLVKTRIGSPYVIEGMEALRSEGRYRRIVGFEANGGFLTGSDIELEGRRLGALPTRDAALPILAALHQTVRSRFSLADLAARLPPRFGKSGLIDDFPPEASRAILRRFSGPGGREALEALFGSEPGFSSIRRIDETDGIRIHFANGEVAHVRPSGNAPQLRVYVVASSQERANQMVRLALAEPDGILRRLERAVD